MKKKGSSVSSKSRGPRTKKKFLEDVYSHHSIREVELKRAEKSIRKQMKSRLWNCEASRGTAIPGRFRAGSTQHGSCTIDGRALKNYNTVDAFEVKGQRQVRERPGPSDNAQELSMHPSEPVFTNLDDRQLVDILTSSHDDQANQGQRNLDRHFRKFLTMQSRLSHRQASMRGATVDAIDEKKS